MGRRAESDCARRARMPARRVTGLGSRFSSSRSATSNYALRLSSPDTHLCRMTDSGKCPASCCLSPQSRSISNASESAVGHVALVAHHRPSAPVDDVAALVVGEPLNHLQAVGLRSHLDGVARQRQ